MALTTIITGPQKASIGAVVLDASISETHNAMWKVTRHPIETGSVVSDHVRREPDSIIMNAEISDIEIGLFAIPDPQRSISAWRRLQEAAQADLVTVVTTLREYQNMQIESLRATRTSATGQVLAFTATLREVFIVDSASAKSRAPQSQQGKGAKAKQGATATESDGIGNDILDWGGAP